MFAAMSTINFKLVTPERIVLEKELSSLSCPTTLGQITVLPHHSPLVATLSPGELVAKTGDNEFVINVTGGFVQVRKGDEVVVLADAAEHSHEISLTRAEEARKRAESAMKEVHLSDEEYAKVAASLERSLMRINIARKHSHRKNPLIDQGTFSE
jgi:F-type H+-transporting ATPase subunit epsilon